VVLPFTALNPSQSQAWLGRSIQQSLLADLTVTAPGRLTSADTEVGDMAAAADVGRKAGARYVVHGSFTTLPTSVGEGLRIMGEVVDCATARPVASFKATGLQSEIFRLEDQVAAQIRIRMPGVLPSPVPPPSVPGAAQSESSPPPPLPEVNEYYQTYAAPQAYVPPQAYYNYYYASPDYGYGYPYGYGIGIGTGFFFGSFYDHGSRFGGFDHNGSGGGHDHFGGHAGSGGGTHVNGGVYNGGHGGHR
jgi:TolB-like protein